MSDPELARDDFHIRPPQALLLTGEGLSRLTPDRLTVLGEMLGGLGLHITTVADLGNIEAPIQEEIEPAPVPATQDEFLAFADEHGYSRNRAHRAWRTLAITARQLPDSSSEEDPYPPVRFIGLQPGQSTYDTLIVDVRSIHERLAASGMSHAAWKNLTERQRGNVHLLAHFVNARIQPEEPLPIPEKGQSS